ncbi:MAG TPA: ArsR family transcriptional regulator [Caldithrix abyssi]|uniref:ArsR family transcriptional regulator n=1 Tax=Caldithrix abyssi TaxID=187145 RepID=A0A7V4U1U0_CALAY|nr:ArsR family transcriptional regulator [Caldithrix abyssi]
MANDVCSTNIVDQKKVNRVSGVLPSADINQSMAEAFKALGDPTRLRIVQALALEELCVCDLSALIDVSVSAISHQLRLLRNLKLVKFRKEGKMAYYSLDDDHVRELITITRAHVLEKK